MGEKSPKKASAKKPGKSLKEKRADKRMKQQHSGGIGQS